MKHISTALYVAASLAICAAMLTFIYTAAGVTPHAEGALMLFILGALASACWALGDVALRRHFETR